MRARGAALPETAVMLGVALTLLFGTVQVGLVGYTQLSADGSAYVAAHAAMLGQNPQNAMASPFPLITPANVSVLPTAPPDPTTIQVNYQLTNASARHGGVQVVRPAHLQASLAQNVLGDPMGVLPTVGVGSGVIEGNMLVSAPGWDLASAPIDSSTTYANQIGYTSDDGNAPPYFVGFHVMIDCMAPAPGYWCTNAEYRSLGTGEFLDADNWGNSAVGAQTGGVYQAMAYHYAVYQKVATILAAMATPPPASTMYTGNASDYGQPPAIDPVSTALPIDKCYQTVQSWDVQTPAQTGTNPDAYPLNPMGSTPGC